MDPKHPLKIVAFLKIVHLPLEIRILGVKNRIFRACDASKIANGNFRFRNRDLESQKPYFMRLRRAQNEKIPLEIAM